MTEKKNIDLNYIASEKNRNVLKYGFVPHHKGFSLPISKEFIFIRNPKVASHYLSQLFVKNSIPLKISGENDFPNIAVHATAYELLHYYFGKEKWDQMFSFGIIRNPFQRAISLYLYWKRTHEIASD